MSYPADKIRVIPQGVSGHVRATQTDLRTKLAHLAAPPWVAGRSPHAQWFVVRSTVNNEFRAAAEIRLLHFRAFVPVEMKWVRHANRRRKVERPLFSRYLFVSFDPAEPWVSICSARGVEALLLRDGKAPAPIDARIVDALFRAQQAGKFDRTSEAAAFGKGSKVTIEEGPFADLIGEVVDGDDKSRVEVLIRLFNMPTKVRLDASLLRAS